MSAIERMREEGLEMAGAVCVVDRLAGGGEAIAEAAGAPFRALLTIDELYPERPDRDRAAALTCYWVGAAGPTGWSRSVCIIFNATARAFAERLRRAFWTIATV